MIQDCIIALPRDGHRRAFQPRSRGLDVGLFRLLNDVGQVHERFYQAVRVRPYLCTACGRIQEETC